MIYKKYRNSIFLMNDPDSNPSIDQSNLLLQMNEKYRTGEWGVDFLTGDYQLPHLHL